MQIPHRKPGKYAQIKPDPLITAKKYAELERGLIRLKQIKRPAAAAEVARLAELGDFSENAEYQLAKSKLRGINNAILKIESQLNSAEIIKFNNKLGTVQIGSTVTVEINGKSKTFLILGSSETNPGQGVISHLSPLGSALIEHKINDEINFTSSEQITTPKIIKILEIK